MQTPPDKQRKALGRGLAALLPSKPVAQVAPAPAPVAAEPTGTQAPRLPISQIEPNPLQPRTVFDAGHLEELANSIKTHGIIQPLLVRRKGPGYELIAGERRLRAAKLAGLTEVPAIVQDFADDQLLEIALIENIQREELNPMETAHAYRRRAAALDGTCTGVAWHHESGAADAVRRKSRGARDVGAPGGAIGEGRQ